MMYAKEHNHCEITNFFSNEWLGPFKYNAYVNLTVTICFSNSAMCAQAHAAVIEPFKRQNEQPETGGAISLSGRSATKQSRSFEIDKTNMKTVEKHFNSDKFTSRRAKRAKQESPIDVESNADAVLYSRKVRVNENEILRVTLDSKVHTEESDLSKVCGNSSAFQGVCGVKRSGTLIEEAVVADCKVIDRQSPCIGKSEFSSLVFTSLSDAIKVWEDAGDEKARKNLPEFNILATVLKWGEPKETKGVKCDNVCTGNLHVVSRF